MRDIETLIQHAEDVGMDELADKIRDMVENDLYPTAPSAEAQQTGRVLPTLTRTVNVASDAGWDPYVVLTRDREAAANADVWINWRRQLESKLRSLIEHFETDEMSSMDMMQVADGLTRMMDKILVKKAEAGAKANAELAANARQSTDNEFDLLTEERIERRIKILRNSWFKFQQGYQVALLARNWTDGYTGSNWSSYIPDHQMRDRTRKEKQEMQLRAFRGALEGKDRAAYERALAYYIAQADGIDSDDGMGGTANKKKANAFRQHQQRLAAKGYHKSRPRAVPKANAEHVDSGETGSRYTALRKEVAGK